MILRFLREEDMHKLFSCKNCKRESSTGERMLDAVVMDVTAMYILGRQPEFERRTCEIEPVQNAAERQYIMRNAKHCQFVDVILASALKIQNRTVFQAPLKPTLCRNHVELKRKFFEQIEALGSEYYAVTKFFSVCFSLRGQEADILQSALDGKDSPTEEHSPKSSLLAAHNFPDFDIRRTISDFGHCFCSVSIAGGALTDLKSLKIANSFRKTLISFSNCQHPTESCNGTRRRAKIC